MWIIGSYPFSSVYDNHGASVLIYGGSRSRWYLSKVVWIAITVLAYYLTMVATSLLFCIATEVPISWEINLFAVSEEFSIAVLLLPIVTSFVTGIFQLFLMTLTTPIVSFIAIAALSAASTYITTPLLFPNCSQFLKLSAFSEAGIGTAESYLTLGIVFALSLTAGLIAFNRRDILKSQRDEE